MRKVQTRFSRMLRGLAPGALYAGALVAMLAGAASAKTNSIYVTDNCAAYDDNGSSACAVSEYNINATTGVLTPVAGSPIQAPPDSEPEGMAVTPNGKFAYVVGDESQAIVEYSRSAGGKLKQLGVVPVDGFIGSCPDEAAIDPAGKFLYVTDECRGFIFEYGINPQTGALTALLSQPFTNASVRRTDGIAIDSTGSFVYVTDSRSRDVVELAIDKTGAVCGAVGCLEFKGTVSDTSSSGSHFRSPTGITVDPLDRFVYAVDRSAGLIASFAIKPDGTLTAVDDNFTNLSTPQNVIVESTLNKFVYVADANGGFNGTISVFSIDTAGTTCFNGAPGCVDAVTAVTPPNGGCPFDLAIDPSGKRLYATEICFNNVLEYTIDRNDCTGGAPTCLKAIGAGLIPAGLEPKNIAVGDPPKKKRRHHH